MANPSAYTFDVKPVGSGIDENGSVHQSSPTWVLTFVRWDVQDPLRTTAGSSPQSIRNVLVVESDCIDLSVTTNKGTLTPNMSAILKISDVNYNTAIHPGDFCFVNMLNWESDAQKVVDKASNIAPINEFADGFKGFFKVQSVRKSIQTDGETGTKTLVVRVEGFAFTEFNNTIYFNPNLVNQKSVNNAALFISDISKSWSNWVSKTTNRPLQDILSFLIHSLIGASFNKRAKNPAGLVANPNEHFLIPQGVGRLLGVVDDANFKMQDFRTKSVGVKDVYFYLFGIQKYSAASDSRAIAPEDGLNPSNLKSQEEFGNFQYTTSPCPGKSVLKAEYWNQVKLWSILNQYVNSPLNELYTCFKTNKYGRVTPHIVFRQIPFTSSDFFNRKLGTQDNNGSITVTPYMSLPRWKIDPAMVMNFDLGTDEAARINFVQFYAKSLISKNGVDQAQEIALRNYVYDKDDIKRSGLRPYIVQNEFSDLAKETAYEAPIWARILGDAVIGGQLKLNGTISCVGIVDPIAVGDNLEFDGVVYHIEQITHVCSINPQSGRKTFRTNISVSHGVSVNSDSAGTKYSEMTYENAYDQRDNDFFLKNKILPGISEAKNTSDRTSSVELPDTPNVNSAFPQPSNGNKPSEGE